MKKQLIVLLLGVCSIASTNLFAQDKMSDGKMAHDQMSDGKMSTDTSKKMKKKHKKTTGTMSNDKMSGDKMSDDKMKDAPKAQ